MFYPYFEDPDPSIYDVGYVAFDLETTGLSAEAEICEIGAIKFSLGKEDTDTFQTLVRPHAKIPWDATAVHGITNEMVKHSPSLEEVLWEFEDFTMNHVLIAHNAKFDLKFLERLKIPNLIVDTLSLSRRWMDGPSYSLGSLMEHKQWHRALPDAIATMDLYKRCVERIEEDVPDRAIHVAEVTRG